MTPFEYTENLDAGLFDEHTNSLSISLNNSPKLLLLRNIIGSVTIKQTLSEIEFNQSIDYLDLENKYAAKNPLERLKDYISSDLTMEDFGGYFANKEFLYQNNGFFDKLNNEFSNFFFYEYKNSHTTAFVYLYRILETISYAFPLIYASKSDDFKQTYSFLRDCFSPTPENKNKGELGFFKSFVKTVFAGDPAFESSVTIEIHGEEDVQKQLFNAFLKACSDNDIFDSGDTVQYSALAVKFSEYSSFIINLRNRFFHLFSSGQPNLQSDEVLDADYFFNLVNKRSLNWICLVLLEVLKFSIGKLERNPSNSERIGGDSGEAVPIQTEPAQIETEPEQIPNEAEEISCESE